MGVSIFSDSDALNLVDTADGFELPFDSTGLEYLQFHNIKNPARNLAAGKPAAIVVGAVTGNDYSLNLSSRNYYIDTGVLQTADEYTLFHVMRAPATSIEISGISSYLGSSDVGMSLMFRSAGSGTISGISAWTNTGGTVGITEATSTYTSSKDYAMAVRTEAGSRINNLTDAKTGRVAASAGAVINKGTKSFLIGSTQGSLAAATPHTHYMSAIFSRRLSDDELQKLYVVAQNYLSAYGITV